MSAPKSVRWSAEDEEIEQEFAEIIAFVKDNETEQRIPRVLDQRVKQFARGSVFDEIEQSWVFGSGARLTLAILVFFAVAMIWLSL
jgi:hypothetical protein